MTDAAEKLPSALKKALGRLPRFALAFSGGVDSRFLAHAARLCGCDVMAINATGPHIGSMDSGFAQAWAFGHGLKFQSIYYDPLDLEEVRYNSRQRCYGCKKGLINKIRQQLAAMNEATLPLCDGGNADDKRMYRPGQRAVVEAGVLSPLAASGLGKQEIRELAAETGLDHPEQPSKPCLLTRLNYGLEADRDDLERIGRCEEEIQRLLNGCGLRGLQFRIRLAPRPFLQIARLQEAALPAVREIIARHGFGEAEIREDDEISGFFDRRR